MDYRRGTDRRPRTGGRASSWLLRRHLCALHRAQRWADGLHIQALSDVVGRPLVFHVPAAALQDPLTTTLRWTPVATVRPHDDRLAPLCGAGRRPLRFGLRLGRVWALEVPWSDSGCDLHGAVDEPDLARLLGPALSALSPSHSALSEYIIGLGHGDSDAPSPCSSVRSPRADPWPDDLHVPLGEEADAETERAEREAGRLQGELRDAVARCDQVLRGTAYDCALRSCCTALG